MYTKDQRRRRLAFAILVLAALILPLCFFVGAFLAPSGARGIVQIPKDALYWRYYVYTHFLSFAGFVLAPVVYPQQASQKVAYGMLSIIGFFLDLAMSMIVVTSIFGFSD